ncbi:MAG: triphosphoribosyl-dephospho-CoA synthase [Candidatus Heimdallarchaeota archaeon]|nr:triphosphoribosyl-dephospho-CoA synthase [Candidatus Heimdallarchaeota archaeon]
MTLDDMRRMEKKSSASISGLIAETATLAASLQVVSNVRPGNISRYHNFNGFSMENYLKFAMSLNQPIIDMATRGIMVEREFIDPDEADMGWILAEAIKQQKKKVGLDHYIGMLISFSPIAAAAGYLLSSGEQLNNFQELRRVAMDFLENSTPEDADNLFSCLYDLNLPRFGYIKEASMTRDEGSNFLLEEEINLFEMYGLYQKKSVIFTEMHNDYQFSFNQGIEAFYDAIEHKVGLPDALTHTFLNVLANYTPIIQENDIDHKLSYKLKQEAIELLDLGGYLSSRGKVMTSKFENTLLNFQHPINLNEIAEITTTISFIGLLGRNDIFD